MVSAATFRDIILALDGVVESSHMGHPDFRANGRIFASLKVDEATGTVKLTPEQQAELLRAHPNAFTPAAGAWGRQGWTVIQFAAADKAATRTALMLAWEEVAGAVKAAKIPPILPSNR